MIVLLKYQVEIKTDHLENCHLSFYRNPSTIHQRLCWIDKNISKQRLYSLVIECFMERQSLSNISI